jgi:hypothetical protein
MLYENQGSPDVIGVYPEIVSTNPQNYQRLARWLLNTADLPQDGPTFAWETGMGDFPLLTVNIIELDLFRPYEGQRSGTAYWVGKGTKQEELVPPGAVEITRSNFPDRNQLASFISKLDYFVSFDPFTAMNVEAVLCGTPTIIYGEHPKMNADQIRLHGWTPYGTTNTIEGLDLARSEVDLAYDHYLSLLPVFSSRIDNFVEVTQSM